MCYNGKCLYCIPIKPACLVLAIINAVANGISMGFCLFVFLIFACFANIGGGGLKIGGVRFKRDVSEDSDLFMDIVLIWLILLPIFNLLNVIFSAVLCNGICNNRPKQVKAYFWYGVVVTVLVAIFSVWIICIDTKYPYSETSGSTGIILLLGCVLHALFLVMVHQTHKKVVQDAMFNGHARLSDLESRRLADKNAILY